MANNGMDTNNTRHIVRIVLFLRNGEQCKMHKIDWCEIGLKLADISAKNVGESDLKNIIKYIMIGLDN